MNLGIIGTGKIGSALIDGIFSINTQANYVFAYDQVNERISALGKKYPGLNLCDQIESVVEKSALLVLAVPFSSIQSFSRSTIAVIENRKPLTLALCGYAPIRSLEKILPSKVAKAYPNINWAVRAGVTIVNFGKHFNNRDKETVIRFLARLGAVYEVSEDQFRPLANLMSCGPALWLKLIDLFIEAHGRRYTIDHKLSLEASQKTIEGTFRLMKKKNYSIEEVIERVATPGGTTEVALQCFEHFLPKIFDYAVEQIGLRDNERIGKLRIA